MGGHEWLSLLIVGWDRWRGSKIYFNIRSILDQPQESELAFQGPALFEPWYSSYKHVDRDASRAALSQKRMPAASLDCSSHVFGAVALPSRTRSTFPSSKGWSHSSLLDQRTAYRLAPMAPSGKARRLNDVPMWFTQPFLARRRCAGAINIAALESPPRFWGHSWTTVQCTE